MRRWLLVLGLVVVVVSIPVAVLALVITGGSALDRQSFKATTTSELSNSGTFSDIKGLSGVSICATKGETVHVMLAFKVGFAGTVRVLDNGAVMAPRAVRVNNLSGDTRDFTFVRRIGNGTHRFRVQWAAIGGTLKMGRGSFAVQYQKGSC
jgi:hypothetical protein